MSGFQHRPRHLDPAIGGTLWPKLRAELWKHQGHDFRDGSLCRRIYPREITFYMAPGKLDKEIQQIWAFANSSRMIRRALQEHYPEREIQKFNIVTSMNPRSNAVKILDRSIAGLPEGVQQIRTRWDAGYFAGDLVKACLERNVEFAIGAMSTGKVMDAAARLGRYIWSPTIGMENTEIAVVDYLSGTWPKDENTVCIARRTRVAVDRLPAARVRRRRTIAKKQLALALEGRIDEVDSYSFILTNLLTGILLKLQQFPSSG